MLDALPDSDPTSPSADHNRPTHFLRASLLEWRIGFTFGKIEILILALFLGVCALTIPFHELWSDEAQAWILARDNSLWLLFRYRLHYEGAPGLWHFILKLLQHLSMPYPALPWAGAVFAAAGIAVFLRWSPFPLLLRILLPFTFFLQYQYAVIARPYVLFPLLAFSLCALFYRPRGVYWFALLSGLLANVSLQGSAFSFVLMALYLGHHYRTHAKSSALLRSTLVYILLLLFAGLTAVPAPDCTIANGGQLATGAAYDLLLRFPGPLPPDQRLPVPPALPDDIALMSIPPLPPVPPMYPVEPSFLHHPGRWIAWYTYHVDRDSQGMPQPQSLSASLLHVAVELLTLATAPVSTSRLLALFFLITLSLSLWAHRALFTLLPWAAILLVSEALWVADHHTGLLFLALLSALWLAANAPRRKPLRASAHTLDRALLLMLTLVALGQISWTVVTIRREIHQPYDPAPDTVAILRQHTGQRMAVFDFFAVDVQPYFAHNPFFNQPHSYWVWTTTANPNGAFFTTIEQHPSLVLFSADLLSPGFTHNDWAPLSETSEATHQRDLSRNPILRALTADHYVETHRFCGHRFMRLSYSYETCHLIFEPGGEAPQ